MNLTMWFWYEHGQWTVQFNQCINWRKKSPQQLQRICLKIIVAKSKLVYPLKQKKLQTKSKKRKIQWIMVC